MREKKQVDNVRVNIPIIPVPKGRPRFSRRSGSTFTPKTTTTFQNAIRQATVLQLIPLGFQRKDFPVFEKGESLTVYFDFIFPRPKNQCRVKDPFGLIWKASLPDGDNLEKAVMDGLKGLLWEDDNQIVELRWRKMYADKEIGRGDRGKPDPIDITPRVCAYVEITKEPPGQITCDNYFRTDEEPKFSE